MTVSRIIFCLIIIQASSFLFCSSIGNGDRKEGFLENKFRIYIRIDTLEIPETMTDAELDVLLVRKSADRFSKLWSAMCAGKNLAGDKEFLDVPLGAVDKGIIVYRIEKEEYAEAFVDFPIDKKTADKYSALFLLPENK